MKKVFAMFADGMEETEGIAVVDVLRRARIEVEVISIKENEYNITTSHGIKLTCDNVINEIDFNNADMIFLPGGLKGVENLFNSSVVIENLKEFAKDKMIAAICAGPSILGRIGLLIGKKATCYPGFEDKLKGAEYVNENVVVDENIITSKGMGTSIDLGLKLIEILVNKEKSDEIKKQIVYK